MCSRLVQILTKTKLVLLPYICKIPHVRDVTGAWARFDGVWLPVAADCDLWGEWIDSTDPTVGDYEAEMLPWWETFCDEVGDGDAPLKRLSLPPRGTFINRGDQSAVSVRGLTDRSAVSVRGLTDRSAVSVRGLTDRSAVSVRGLTDRSAVSVRGLTDRSAVSVRGLTDRSAVSVRGLS